MIQQSVIRQQQRVANPIDFDLNKNYFKYLEMEEDKLKE